MWFVLLVLLVLVLLVARCCCGRDFDFYAFLLKVAEDLRPQLLPSGLRLNVSLGLRAFDSAWQQDQFHAGVERQRLFLNRQCKAENRSIHHDAYMHHAWPKFHSHVVESSIKHKQFHAPS
jgi:hypothetical protein